jgi:hypothetical protein
VVVNLSAASAGGRVLFSRADDSAYASEATAAAAARVASLAAPAAGDTLFVDRLPRGAAPLLASAAALAGEGLALELGAWEARCYMLVAAGPFLHAA